MKPIQFAVASCITFALAGYWIERASACDRCGSRANTACSCRDDRGLLDLVDSMAGRFHSKLKSGFKSPFTCTTDCGCDSCQRSSCDTCPNCSRQPPAYSYQPPVPTQRTPLQPQPVPHGNTPRPRVPDYYQADPVEPQYIPPESQYRQPVPPVQTYPVPPPPLPDAQVDPFRDDTALRYRQTPARTIQYQRPVPPRTSPSRPQSSMRSQSYGTRYDKQAAVAPNGYPPVVERSSLQPRSAAVVTASGESPARGLHQLNAPSGLQPVPTTTVNDSYRPDAVPAATVEYFNPLRP
ncbi:MAG: hypothetical protein KDB22_03080 [Planctomycetales bacterium]|nr:hypothetical protein [Planctomycetales bacterium]